MGRLDCELVAEMTNPSNLLITLFLSLSSVALASPAPTPYHTDNLEKLAEQIVEKKDEIEQGKLVLEETSDVTTLTPTDISTAEDSSFPFLLELIGYLAAIPLLAISPFLLLAIAVFILPLLAGGSLILILMVLGGSFAIMVPLIFGMPVLFLPLLLLAALDSEQPIVLPELEKLLEGSGLSEDETMQINISDLISALATTSPEKGIDWNEANFTSSSTTNIVDDGIKFNEENGVDINEETDDTISDSVNSIPHSAVPRLLSW